MRVGHLVVSKLAPVEVLSERVVRILACNPGNKTLQGTNTYLVGTGHRRILIDTGEAGKSEYVATLTNVLAEHNVVIDSIIITHWHPDHVGGVSDVSKHVMKATPDKPADVWKIKRRNGAELDIGQLATYRDLHDGQVMSVEGATLRIVHTPGHSDDSISLLLEEDKSLFTGDCVLGETPSYYENYSDLVKSLHTILALAPRVLYPGHGAVVMDTVKYVQAYIDHRQMREQQIVDTLKSGQQASYTVEDIVANIYEDLVVLEHKGIARLNTTHHLIKLQEEGVVERQDDATGGTTRWRYIS